MTAGLRGFLAVVLLDMYIGRTTDRQSKDLGSSSSSPFSLLVIGISGETEEMFAIGWQMNAIPRFCVQFAI